MRPLDLPAPSRRARCTLAVLLLLASLNLFSGPVRAAADAATLTTLGAKQSGDEFLSPEQAFRVEARATAPDRIEITYGVTKG